MKDQQAFPNPMNENWQGCPGMTMRQYYKAAMLSSLPSWGMVNTPNDEKYTAEICAKYADAMLAEDAEFEAKQ